MRVTKRGTLPRRRSGTRAVPALGIALVLVAGIVYMLWSRSGGTPADAGAVTDFPHIHGMGTDPLAPDVLWLGTHGMLVKVAGRTRWTRVGPANYDLMGFNVHPTKPGVLLTSGHPGPGDARPNPLGVEISTDGGQTWVPVSMAGQADFHAVVISPDDPQVIYAWNVSGAIGFYRSRDGGRQWTHVPTTAFRQVFALAASPANQGEVWAGTEAGLFRSRDGGSRWQPVNPNLTGFPVTAIALHLARPSVAYAYAATPQLGLIRSNDGGKTWTPLGLFLGTQDAVGYLALDPKNPNSLYRATFSSRLFRSEDGGRPRRMLVREGRVLTR